MLTRPHFEVQDILAHSFDGFRLNNQLDKDQYKAANDILRCRTAVLGGHTDSCTCGYTRISYNSCRNRSCPKCGSLKREAWIEGRLCNILDVRHFHAVFTVPSAFNAVALANKDVFYDLLFKVSTETVKALAADKKHLGALPGMTAVLHTWGKNLSFHPHIHMIVTGGGYSDTGWRQGSKKFFLPVRAMSRKFRGLFVSLLRKAYLTGGIAFEKDEFDTLLDTVMGQEWVVYCKKPFKGSEGVYRYLGNYTHRTAITNSRLVEVTAERTTFTYKDYKDKGRQKILVLDNGEFIRRFLLHVPPRGFTRIRHYGIYASANKKTKLAMCMVMTKTKKRVPEKETMEEIVLRLYKVNLSVCPECGGLLSSSFLPPALPP
ncbi:MAG: IS91 family transposase [Spirochaetales bacterium]|nr:IS91 family transposase [Spirochaetales bacterium]